MDALRAAWTEMDPDARALVFGLLVSGFMGLLKWVPWFRSLDGRLKQVAVMGAAGVLLWLTGDIEAVIDLGLKALSVGGLAMGLYGMKREWYNKPKELAEAKALDDGPEF